MIGQKQTDPKKCKITKNMDVIITNTKGEEFCSDLSKNSENITKTQEVFAKKILSFAEIALGRAA